MPEPVHYVQISKENHLNDCLSLDLSRMLLFLFSSFLIPLYSRSFKSFVLSAYSLELQYLSCNTCKNYALLLLSGILVIIIGRSGLSQTRWSSITPFGPRTTHNDPWFNGHGHAEEKLPMAVKGEFLIQKDEIQDQGSESGITEATHDNDDDDDDSCDNNNKAHGESSIEEFNRKCDNFIKETKGEPLMSKCCSSLISR
ncbi:hypothetical protein ACJRO7_030257 [Eucalyptus globulus]|uniref:Uncharacterized protein n=1 Tax=Eucalyptus globulus TaxID=34317 RepID=A0ABD3JLW3_EUCGL